LFIKNYFCFPHQIEVLICSAITSPLCLYPVLPQVGFSFSPSLYVNKYVEGQQNSTLTITLNIGSHFNSSGISLLISNGSTVVLDSGVNPGNSTYYIDASLFINGLTAQVFAIASFCVILLLTLNR
jgi:hypothetical protein